MIQYPTAIFTKCIMHETGEELLGADVIDILTTLDKQFHAAGIPDDVKHTSTTVGVSRQRGRSHPPPREEEKWATRPSFKATELGHAEGIEKQLNDIRVSLNKISVKTYDDIATSVIAAIADIAAAEIDADTGAMERVAQFVFDISSANKFFAKLYAELYSLLITKFAIFGDFLAKFVDGYTARVDELKYVNPEIDYDLYCVYTKGCDKRKAVAAFISHLVVIGTIHVEKLCNIVSVLTDRTNVYICAADHIADVEEIGDVLAIFISICVAMLKSTTYWNGHIIPAIKAIAEMKTRDCPGLSSRALFKYQDMIPCVKK